MFLRKTSSNGAQQTFAGFSAAFSLAAWKKPGGNSSGARTQLWAFEFEQKVFLNNIS